MTETKKALSPNQGGNKEVPQATNIAARGAMSRSWVLGLLFGGLIFEVSAQARADPPTANRVLFDCTFTTGPATTPGTLNSALNIPDITLLNGGQLQASYIIIYVRENPNDGQQIGTTQTYTGPVICRNAGTDSITKTTEGATIPPDPDLDPPIDILGAEEASHLQYQESSTVVPNTNPKQKRVCHTVASNTDCFLIRPQSLSLE